MTAIAHPVAFLGDAAEAAGFALAGIATFVAAPGDEAGTFERARAAAQVVLVAPRCAARLPAAALEGALAAGAPLTLVLADASGAPHALDPVARARRQMGFET